MQSKYRRRSVPHTLLLAFAGALLTAAAAHGDTCTTQSQIPVAQRETIAGTARTIVNEAQGGDIQGIRAKTMPAIAADFTGIANSIEALKPALQNATITVNTLYLLDAQSTAGGQGNTFYCSPPASTMTVVLNFSALPAGKYAVAILHATGVAKPQQVALVLSHGEGGQWQLAGFFSKPMLESGHDGIWYWTQARQFAAKKMNLNAWYYYQTAAGLLQPADFLSSPNLDKLRREADQVHPGDLPEGKSMTLASGGNSFEVTGLYETSELGSLDLAIHYNPTAAQAAQLRDPVAARQQVLDLMKAMLAIHPELREAFHGIWVHADSGNASIFALELSMDQITGSHPTA